MARAPLALSCALALSALCGTATAQESPIFGAFELKFGGYTPSELDGGVPQDASFDRFFGGESLFISELEIDVYLWQGIGKLGIGGHVGYGSRSGSRKPSQTLAPEQMDSFDSSALGDTRFRIIPLRASVVYRYDYSAIEHGVPLVPVVRAGLDYYLWRIDDGDDVASSGGVAAEGGKSGWHASLALHLLLDVIEPSSAAYFDLNWGINNSYLFAEYMITRIDGFGDQGFDLSDNFAMFGLAFEY